ncbi:hypothetical protein B0H13DRAFT_2271862 [Mycena leptocephala]|nr:hypothetical protein B0H13DRAFT_2271862 [Mycena leptocephala]
MSRSGVQLVSAALPVTSWGRVRDDEHVAQPAADEGRDCLASRVEEAGHDAHDRRIGPLDEHERDDKPALQPTASVWCAAFRDDAETAVGTPSIGERRFNANLL